MKNILVLSLLFSSIVFAGEVKKVEELRLYLEDGGYVSITTEPCGIKLARDLGLTNRAVGLELNGTKHEGCWNSPDVSKAEQIPGMRLIPIVNLYFDNEILTIPFEWFQLPSSPNEPAPGEIWI